MQRLINDLLAFSRVDARGKPFAPMRTDVVVDSVIASLAGLSHSFGATITREGLADIMADELQMTQVFQNLIGNAVKFHGPDKPVIHVGGKEDEREWTFWIKDNGIGIAKEYFEKIFVIFQRLHGMAKYEGTGIGLALAKKVVERHGGRIWVESEPGYGSVFYFTISKRLGGAS